MKKGTYILYTHYINTCAFNIHSAVSMAVRNDDFQKKYYAHTQPIDNGYSLELPQSRGSIEYPHSMFKIKKKYTPVNPSFTIYYLGFWMSTRISVSPAQS